MPSLHILRSKESFTPIEMDWTVLTYVTNQDGGGQHGSLRIGEEVIELDHVKLISDLRVVIVPGHEVGQNESSHDRNPLKSNVNFLSYYVSGSQPF